MISDGLANAFINITLFIILILFVRTIQAIHKKNFTPMYWINIKKHDIKLLLFGVIIALLYKLSVGLIGVISGTMTLVIDKSGIVKSVIFIIASSFGFFGVALFEEGLFRGYIMQVVLKKFPKLLAIILQAFIFGLIHYNNYSVLPNTWIRIINAMLIGVIFGVIVIKTKSLMFVIGSHLFYNVIEQALFIDNQYKFTRFISFQNYNHLELNLLGVSFYTEFIELIMLSIITLILIFLFRKNILYKKSNKYFLDT